MGRRGVPNEVTARGFRNSHCLKARVGQRQTGISELDRILLDVGWSRECPENRGDESRQYPRNSKSWFETSQPS